MMILPAGNKTAPRSELGFTLVELILVMALLVIVLAVCAPSLSKFFHGRTLNSEARRFVSLTRYGQSRAVSEGVPMELWINPRQGIYGLRQQAGYAETDPKAVEFDLDPELSIEVIDLAPAAKRNAKTGQASMTLPTIRFLPSGVMGDTSPQTIVIAEGRADEAWIQQSWNGLHYQIETNAIHQRYR